MSRIVTCDFCKNTIDDGNSVEVTMRYNGSKPALWDQRKGAFSPTLDLHSKPTVANGAASCWELWITAFQDAQVRDGIIDSDPLISEEEGSDDTGR